MKSLRGLIILIVILLLLGGAYFFIDGMSNTDTSGGVDKTIKVLELQSDTITGVTIDNNEGKFTFAKENDLWKLTSSQNLRIDSSRIESLAAGMATLNAEKVIEENTADLVQYGLDKPVVVSVKMSDGTEKSIDIGNVTPTGDGYYVKETGKNKVYTLSTYAGSTLKVSRNDIRDKAIFTVNLENVNGFTFERSGEILFKTNKEKAWTMTFPAETWIDSAQMNSILGDVVSLNVMSFIEDNAVNLEQYGLKTPGYVFEINTAGGKTKLLLGSEKEKGALIYAKLADSNEVFTVNAETLVFRDKQTSEILTMLVYQMSANDVTGTVVEMDGKSTTSEIQIDSGGDPNKDKFIVDGKDATAKDENGNSIFMNYYSALTNIAVSNIEPGAKPSGKSEITITYKQKAEPKNMKFEFVSKDADNFYVLKNGKYTGCVVAKSEFDKQFGVRATYLNLLETLK